MYKIDRKQSVMAGIIAGTFGTGLLILGVAGVLGNPIDQRNLLAFVGFGIVVGLVTAALMFFRLKIAGPLFGVGLLVGYFEMFRAFFSDMGGWGDLAGIISVLLWPSVGLGVGLILQAAHHLYVKFRGRNHG